VKKFSTALSTAAVFAAGAAISGAAFADNHGLSDKEAAGLDLYMNKGNCIACHQSKDGELGGNIGPAMIAMKVRYPDPDELYAVIYEPRDKFPNTIMPPMGTHKLLSDEEIKQVVAYLYTL